MTGTADDKYRRAVQEVFEQALTDSGLTQEAFARAMGTSGSRYSTYRRGLVMPRATTMLRAQRIAAEIRRNAD
jgi:transcriptional regulator with XRE-family HTH domain